MEETPTKTPAFLQTYYVGRLSSIHSVAFRIVAIVCGSAPCMVLLVAVAVAVAVHDSAHIAHNNGSLVFVVFFFFQRP